MKKMKKQIGRQRKMAKEKERNKRGKQEKQGPTSLFRGGCCGINSVKSRRADRVSGTERKRERKRGGRGESS